MVAIANASLSDVWTVRAEDLPNTLAVHGFYRLSGGLSTTSTGVLLSDEPDQFYWVNTSAISRVTVSGSGVTSASGESQHAFVSPNDPHVFTRNLPIIRRIPFTRVLNKDVPTQITMQISVQATANVEATTIASLLGLTGTAFARADFLHTLEWGGITSVTDALTGAPIQNWSVTSASGFDYMQTIPEPSSWILVPGLLASASFCRRRWREA